MKKFNEEQRDAVRVALIISKALTAKLEAQVARDGDQFTDQVACWQQFSTYEIECEQLRVQMLKVANGGIDVDPDTGDVTPKESN